LREALSRGGLSHHGNSPKAIQMLIEAYASGLASTMAVAALLVGILGVISLLLLVVGHQQRRRM
jgi:hypothetical protein